MKILIVGSTDIWAIENYFFKYLSMFENTQVDQFPTSSTNNNLSIIQKIERRIFPNKNTLYRIFNSRLLDHVEVFKPDVVLVFKGMEIFPKTLRRLKEKKIRLANFNGDHPFLIYSRGSGNHNVVNSVSLYDLHFTYILSIVKRLKEEFDVSAIHLPFGYELDNELYTRIQKESEILRIAFIGNPDNTRLNSIQRLLDANLPVDVYGNGWDVILSNAKGDLQIYGPVYGEKFWNIARKYRVQLNIFRPHNEGSHNMRTFEMPAVGAIMLAPDSEEHHIFFEADQEVLFYSSLDEMIEKAQYLLDLSSEVANQIRMQARERSLQTGYSYQDRANLVYHSLKQLLS